MIKTSDVREQGNSMVTTIPKKICEMFDINKDDILIWTPVKDGIHVTKLMDTNKTAKSKLPSTNGNR